MTILCKWLYRKMQPKNFPNSRNYWGQFNHFFNGKKKKFVRIRERIRPLKNLLKFIILWLHFY